MTNNYKDTIEEIYSELRRNANGIVVETMFEMLGTEKYVNHGVSVPAIKEVASRHAPNHRLAEELFKTNIRELKIAAVYIDNPNEVTLEQMEQWSKSFDAIDILENCCSMLFSRAPQALIIAKKLMNDMPYASLLIASRRASLLFHEQELMEYHEIVNRITPFSHGAHFELKCRLIAALKKNSDTFDIYLDDDISKEIEWLTN